MGKWKSGFWIRGGLHRFFTANFEAAANGLGESAFLAAGYRPNLIRQKYHERPKENKRFFER